MGKLWCKPSDQCLYITWDWERGQMWSDLHKSNVATVLSIALPGYANRQAVSMTSSVMDEFVLCDIMTLVYSVFQVFLHFLFLRTISVMNKSRGRIVSKCQGGVHDFVRVKSARLARSKHLPWREGAWGAWPSLWAHISYSEKPWVECRSAQLAPCLTEERICLTSADRSPITWLTFRKEK